MADDQKPKTMDINDLVRELSKSSTNSVTPPPAGGSAPQTPRPSFPTPKPPMAPMAGLPSVPSIPKPSVPSTPIPPSVSPPQPKPLEVPRPQFNASPLGQSKPAPVPSPAAPLPATGVKEYQSSIRTMNEDISKLKQGQKPIGIDVPRKVEQIVPVSPVTPTPVKPVVPQFKVPDVNLGETKKSASLAPTKTFPGITIPGAPKAPSGVMPSPKLGATIPVAPGAPKIYIPQEGVNGGNRNVLFLGIGAVAIVAGFVYWFFVLRLPAPEVVIESPTPTPTQVPTPAPLPLEKLGIAEKVSIPSASVFLSSLTAEMNAKQLSTGQIRLLDIVDENQQKYSFKEFLIKLSIDTSTLNDSTGLLDTREWVLGLYGQLGANESSSVRPFIVLTQNDSTLVTNVMNAWEPRIINDLAKLFNLSKISAKLTFIPDVYSGVNFRFVRIPDKDLGVAYAVIQNYLVLGSSRDSFRAVLSVLALRPD